MIAENPQERIPRTSPTESKGKNQKPLLAFPIMSVCGVPYVTHLANPRANSLVSNKEITAATETGIFWFPVMFS